MAELAGPSSARSAFISGPQFLQINGSVLDTADPVGPSSAKGFTLGGVEFVFVACGSFLSGMFSSNDSCGRLDLGDQRIGRFSRAQLAAEIRGHRTGV